MGARQLLAAAVEAEVKEFIDLRECEYKQLILEVENPEKMVSEINNTVDKSYV